MTSAQGHLRPSCTIAADGSLSPDSCRARRMLLTAESGQKPTFRVAVAREQLLVKVHGTTKPLMLAHGFIDRMLARLARARLIETRSRVAPSPWTSAHHDHARRALGCVILARSPDEWPVIQRPRSPMGHRTAWPGQATQLIRLSALETCLHAPHRRAGRSPASVMRPPG